MRLGGALIAVALAFAAGPASCGAAGAAAQGEAARQKEETSMSNGSLSPTGEKHPGTIHNLDRATGREWDEAAADVPQVSAWVKVDGRWTAVVRTEAVGDASRLEITKFGADGALLETTVMMAPPPDLPADPVPVPVPVLTPEPND